MTLQECYAMMHGNYEDARSRLAMDKLIEKFMLKFLDDTSMDLLNKSVAAGDVQESFSCSTYFERRGSQSGIYRTDGESVRADRAASSVQCTGR